MITGGASGYAVLPIFWSTAMTRTLLALALLAPGLALADRCEHSAPRSLDLDLDGVREVRLEIGSDNIEVVAGNGPHAVSGRACASDADVLDRITITQERRGDVLVVRAESGVSFSGIFFKQTYAYLELQANLPAVLPLRLDLGSGEATIRGIDSVTADVGSGELAVHDAQRFAADVGSGDIEAERIAGPVRIEVGSGDAELSDIGALEAARVGSGDLSVRGIGGDVRVESVGSGDLSLRDVRGTVVVESVGSGDLTVNQVSGDLRVDTIGSGDVRHAGVAGQVSLPED
jgi:hypothetical protein